ncbi:hypothetical protein, conserved [Eimeria praecox]|uniref:TPR domain-containing protein n=1 Tax=Eimeria praecox TaxID=51316 RepID=U6H9H5_9EIME|nr:hypothetical protein, conserved [Eimeria praecox]
MHKMPWLVLTVILEVSTSAAQTWIVQGNFGLAVAGALYATRTAEMLFGTDSLEVVHPQLLLAQIYLGLNQLHSAEELLNMAERGLAKHPEAGRSARCSLYRNFGRLYACQNKYDQALRACAMDAEVFRKCGRAESHTACNAMYKKVCDIIIRWFEQNANMAANRDEMPSPKPVLQEENQRQDLVKSELEIQEAMETLRHIIEYAKDNHTESPELHYEEEQASDDEAVKRHDEATVAKQLRRDAKEQQHQIAEEAAESELEEEAIKRQDRDRKAALDEEVTAGETAENKAEAAIQEATKIAAETPEAVADKTEGGLSLKKVAKRLKDLAVEEQTLEVRLQPLNSQQQTTPNMVESSRKKNQSYCSTLNSNSSKKSHP